VSAEGYSEHTLLGPNGEVVTGCRVWATAHAARFDLCDLMGIQDDGAVLWCSPDDDEPMPPPTESMREARADVGGDIKWDGCMHLRIPGCWHGCHAGDALAELHEHLQWCLGVCHAEMRKAAQAEGRDVGYMWEPRHPATQEPKLCS
jgi:hypothetical protein